MVSLKSRGSGDDMNGRHAILIDGKVTNVIIWDGSSPWHGAGQPMPCPDHVGPGWEVSDGRWVAPIEPEESAPGPS
jgi:hypothetical protein